MEKLSSPDAILLGGPRNGTLFTAGDTSEVALELDSGVQRYLRTGDRQQHRGRPLTVFVYAGATRPPMTSPGRRPERPSR